MYQVVKASQIPKDIADRWVDVSCFAIDVFSFMFSLDKYAFISKMSFAFRYNIL